MTNNIKTENKQIPHFIEYLTNIKECSLLLFIGGGYMNRYWGCKIYQFISTLSIAHEVGIPCIASGQTFGPLDDIQKKIVKKHINKLDYISTRDINRSKKRLLELGFDENKIIEGPDDAIFLSKNMNYINRYDSSFVVTVNFGLFLKYSKYPLEYIYTIFAQFFDYLVDSKNAIILNISMTISGKDIEQGLSIQSKMKHKDKFYFVPLYTDLKTIKAIISTSDLVVSSRLHPIVFSISERRPYIGISGGGEYYNSKLMGISEIYSYISDNHIIEADNLSLDKLKNLLSSTLNEDYRLNNIYELNETKRNNFLKKVDSYFYKS
ncbi:polysaccharide pyruvyl transferase family protein [Methanosarcina barkeri]|uniref:polysaccharide pyruvyl transferase family protein n=1 Tax=Methanosarcina barkeri TaxID=2208 RepID=UPI00311DB5C4